MRDRLVAGRANAAAERGPRAARSEGEPVEGRGSDTRGLGSGRCAVRRALRSIAAAALSTPPNALTGVVDPTNRGAPEHRP